MEKTRKVVNFPLMFAGVAFLFNPVVGLIDVLPDVIGYALLIASIRGLVDMLPYFEEARVGFLRLAWISASKYVALAVIASIVGHDPENMTLYLVFSFSYAILEMIFFFPAFRAFFRAMSYLGERYGCRTVLYMPAKVEKPLDALVVRTIVFFVFRASCSFLPDVCYLYATDKNGLITPQSQAIYHLHTPLLILFGLIALGVGVAWLVRMEKYLLRVSRDESLRELIDAKYARDVAPLTGRHIYRAVRTATTFLAVGVAFAADVVIDSINLLPDAVSGLLLLLAILTLRPLVRDIRVPAVLGAVYTAVAALSGVMQYHFGTYYDYLSLGTPDADRYYAGVCIVGIVENALLIALVLFLEKALYELTDRHTGHTEAGISSELAVEKTRNATKKMIRVSTVLGIICAAAQAIYTCILSITTEIRLDPTEASSDVMIAPRFAYSWYFVFLFALAWFISTVALTNRLQDQAEEKYIFFGEGKK